MEEKHTILSFEDFFSQQFGSRLPISREVRDRIGAGQRSMEPLGLVQVKGRSEPLEIFKLA